MSKTNHRILVMSHAHPDFSLGGGEIAAYNLYQAYRQNPQVEEAWFLARADRNRGLTGAISQRRQNEFLWEQSVHDWHLIKAAHRDSLTTWFTDLIRGLRPTVVHAHHYAHLGLEFLRIIKQVDPAIKIMLTLHEYMAICRQNGQMLKAVSFKLCSSESPDECRQCFPDQTAEDFWLRKHFIRSHFDLVDQFVSPSEFLRGRYIEWGIPADRIVVIENGQADEPPLPARPLGKQKLRNRFAFFGQVNPFKGIDLLLEALHVLEPAERAKMVVEIHGANLEQQQGELQEKIKKLAAPLIEEKVLHWMGPYRPSEQRQRMANADWVLVPSIWWENSPMVIQEAFVCGRPVICADIGGMAEKVRHGVDGLHVPARNPDAWAQALLHAATTAGIWEPLAAGIRKPITKADCAQAHVELIALTTGV